LALLVKVGLFSVLELGAELVLTGSAALVALSERVTSDVGTLPSLDFDATFSWISLFSPDLGGD